MASVVTGDDGTYLFEGVAPGEYDVTMTVPDAEVVLETPDGDPVAEITTDEDGDFVLPTCRPATTTWSSPRPVACRRRCR